jgi:tripeptide aminopeptidase
MVRIYSPSLREGEMKRYCRAAFEAMGCIIFEDDAGEVLGADTGNLMAILPAKVLDPVTGDLRISEFPESRRVVLSAHMDCVEPCEGIEPVISDDGIITSAGDTILTADDRSGVAPIIEVMRAFHEAGKPHPEIIAILTIAEEIGLRGARALTLPEYLRPFDGELCLVLDAEGTPGGITIGAPFHWVFDATFRGRSAHAGVEPEQGRNAIVMAANAIGRMRIGRLDAHTTANVGTIHTDGAINVVADSCRLTGECRSLHGDKARELRDSMDEALHAAAAEMDGTVDVEWELEYPGFSYGEDDERVRTLLGVADGLGLEAKTITSGGGSDANVLAGYGLCPMAISTGMRNFHSTDECLSVKDLCDTADFVLRVILSTWPGDGR